MRGVLRKNFKIKIVRANFNKIASILEASMPEPDYHYDRRNGIERRYISYTIHIPERRSRDDRRRLKDQTYCMENEREKDSLNVR